MKTIAIMAKHGQEEVILTHHTTRQTMPGVNGQSNLKGRFTLAWLLVPTD